MKHQDHDGVQINLQILKAQKTLAVLRSVLEMDLYKIVELWTASIYHIHLLSGKLNRSRIG